MKKFLNRASILLIIILSFLSVTGCESENNEDTENLSPANYTAEDFSLPEELQVITAAAVKDSTVFLGVLKGAWGNQADDSGLSDTAGAVYYIDFLAEHTTPVMVPYSVENNSSIMRISPNDDDTLDLLIQKFSEIEGEGITETWIKKITVNGEELSCFSLIKDVNKQDLMRLAGFTTDNSGNAFAIFSNILYIWDRDENLTGTIQIPGNSPCICKGQDGMAYLMWQEADGFQISSIDANTGILKPPHTLSKDRTYLDMASGNNGNLLLAGIEGIYELDINQGKEEILISFPQLDITAGFGGKLLSLSDGSTIWYYNNTFTVIRYTEQAKQSEKNTLLFGGTDDSFFLWHKNAVAKFNRSHSNVRIEIRTYDTDKDDEIRELNMDIVNGKGPDIMILPRQFSMSLYSQKEVLTDLYPFIDNDKTMKRSDFQENILKAYEVNEKLYAIPVYYWIRTMVASKASTGGISQWNLDDMIAYADHYLPDSTVFSSANKSYVLNLCLMANGDCMINWKERRFNRELFMKMLLFADRFVSDGSYTYNEKLIEQIQDTRKLQIICNQSITGFSDQQIYLEAFGEPVSYPGFPAENGNGNLIDSNFVLAINRNCMDKDAAWQFISSLLSEEFQRSPAGEMGFPVLKKALEQKIRSEMKKSFEIGKSGLKIEKEKEIRSFGADQIVLYAARQEDVQTILDVVNSAEKICVWNDQVIDIIKEETGAFFDGSKIAEEVADIVENRIQIYIKEME